MKKYNLFFFFFLFSFGFGQVIESDNYLSNGIIEDENGKIIKDNHLREKFLKERSAKIEAEKKHMHKAAPTLAEMCSNGGFEQFENVNGKNVLKNFLYNIGDPPGPTQCRSISNSADSYINQYDPTANNLMATTVPANMIDSYMGDIKAFDQYALKINYPNSSTYGSIVQGKRFKTNNENFLKFNYKAILQSVYDNSHTDNQAFFKARILNKTGAVVSEFCLVGDEKNCIFAKVPDGGSGYVTLYTTNWQSGILDISSIANNEEFTVEFMASRCGLGGHFGYAYVDDICLLHSNESFIGSITLDPLNAVCPTLPINVSGVFTLPNSGGVTASVKNITLKLFNDAGVAVYTTQAATMDNVNKKFNFTLNNTNIPNTNQANYNVGVYIEYDIQGSSCGGNFFSNASDIDANEGWDISFLNCSSSCNIPVTTAKISKCDAGQDGVENFNLTDFDSKIVSSTAGLNFTYFKNYNDAYSGANSISNFTSYPSGTGTIYVRVSRDASCYKIISASLEVRNPTANITGVLNVCSGSTNLTASAGSSFLWSPGGETTQTVTVTDVGVYSVVVTDSYRCSSTASVSIEPSQTAVTPTLDVTQPSCFVSYGTIKVTSPASEYSFDNGATWTTNSTKTNLYPGKYFIKIKTAKGCLSYAQEVDIFQSLLPYPYVDPKQPLFCGDTGTITVTTAAAYYSFDNGVTWVNNAVADKLQPGRYTIRTKDAVGCISNPQVVVIQSQTLGYVDYTLQSPACSDLGTITINTPADYYTFDGGATWVTTNVLNNVVAGNFSVGVKNYLGCISYFTSIYVTKFESLSPTYDVIQPECGADGTIYIKTEAAQYSFDNGVTWTTSNLAELPPGTYRIKVKNSANCISQSQSVTLYPPTLPIPIYTAENPGCGVNGKITINSVYDFYSFDNGVTWVTTNSKILPAGSYQILVKNNIGCKSSTQYITLYEQKLPAPSFKAIQPTCSVKGSITINTVADYYSINGGSTWSTNPVFSNLSGYSFNIVIKNNLNCISETGYAYFNQVYLEAPTYTAVSPSCGNTIGGVKFTSVADKYSINGGSSWSVNPDFNNLPKGYYYLMVEKGGCRSNSISVELNDYNLATPSVSIVQPACGIKGSITVNAVADSYSIDGGYTWVSTPVFNNLNPGYYYVYIKSGTCKSSGTSVNLQQFYLDTPNYTTTPPTCGVGGTITITTPSDFYSVNGGNTWSTNPVFSNLASGYYNVMIKNNQNCTSSNNSSVNINKFYLPKPDVEIIQPKCGQNGSIRIATPATQYSFDGGNTWTSNPLLSNLTTGYYNIVIKNAQNCTSDPYAVYVSITTYYLPRPMINVVQPTCSNNGSITVVSNAAFYSFDNGTTWGTSATLLDPAPGYYNIKTKNTAGCISVAASVSVQKYFLSSPQVRTIQPTCASPSGTIIVNTIADLYSFDNGTTWVSNPIKTNANSGSYNVLIKNSFGCISQSAYAYINSAPNIPAAPAVTVVQPTACDSTDGSIKINTTALSYSFNDGASWTTNPVKNNLGSGTYIIKLRINTYSCESQTTVVNLDSGVAIAAPDVAVTAPTCSVATGSITVTSVASTYSFDNGLTFTYNNSKSGLLPGTYHVKVKNTNGCISNVATAVISTPAPLPAPVYVVNHPNCSNVLGEIKITSTAAEFSFDNGLTFGASDTKSNLSPGTYNLMIKDAAGCISLAAMVTINTKPITPDLPQVAITQPIGCTASTGNISVISPAGFYSFDDGATWSTTSNATLAPGTYLVRQKLTTNGCPSMALSVTIDTPPNAPVLPVYSVNQPASCVSPFGDITISTPSAFYSFDNGLTYSSNSNSGQLAPGTYRLKTKNSAGCESVAVSVVVKKPVDTPVMPAVQVQQLDCHHPSGEIIINTSAVQYSIDDGVTWSASNSYQLLAPNTYNVRYKNAIGCVSDPTQVIINTYINNTPTPVANAQQNFCIQNRSTVANIKIAGTSVTWYDSPFGGAILPASTLLIDGKTYFASQIVATCESNRVPVTVSISATLPPTGNSPQLFCISENAKLSDINITGNAIKWYSDNVSTVSLPATTVLQDGFTYYATQTVDGCESVLRTPIMINITSNAIPGLVGPDITNVNIENTTATIIIKGSLVYEYSLNNQNSWQDSNVYKDLPTGLYKVYVREKTNICAVSVKEFTIFKINNMITPNGDGINDGWEIEGLENYPGTVVRVMDKNGKIVLETTVKGKFFWNGSFLGRPLPTDNYWYHIILTDGRLLTGFVVIKNRN